MFSFSFACVRWKIISLARYRHSVGYTRPHLSPNLHSFTFLPKMAFFFFFSPHKSTVAFPNSHVISRVSSKRKGQLHPDSFVIHFPIDIHFEGVD